MLCWYKKNGGKTTQKRAEELPVVSGFFFLPFGKELEQHNRPLTSPCRSHQWCTSLVYSEYANWHVNGKRAVAAPHENSLFGPSDHERSSAPFVGKKSILF